MNTKKYDYVFKVVITGDSQVGKTTLLKKYIDDPTIDKHFGRSNGLSGRPYLIKAVQKGSLNVRLEIHDTMGNCFPSTCDESQSLVQIVMFAFY